MTLFREAVSVLGPIIALGGFILLSFGLGVGDGAGMLAGALLIPLGILVRRYSKYIDGENEDTQREEHDDG